MAQKTYAWISLWSDFRADLVSLFDAYFLRFLLTAPLMIWDAGYCLMRPRSMPGGDLYWFWKPYEAYGMVDYVRAPILLLFKALIRLRFTVSKPGRTAMALPVLQASILNLLETFANIGYLVGTHVYKSRSALLVGYTGATATLAKTLLYSLNQYFCNGCAVGHNTFFNLFTFWIFPNIMWMVFPGLIMWRLGSDMMNSMAVASKKHKTD
ncbi:hypothetical protein MVEN_02460300 [Mycena venus]|uniref:EXPERA domain-containing protein n=1 Tax=Mycena venus TaxID=2733690 RepID=A0A8H6WX21_9AGAR|nr:hypothetical protein MVEN_02460300 [Mycena venus]